MPKILIVDDEPEIVEGLEILFRHYDYETVTAENGVQALEKIGSEKPDLVLLDVLMPRMSGLEVVGAIKKQSLRVPVIAMSARPAMQSFFDRWDIQHFVTKPFDYADLLAKIEGVIGKGVRAPKAGKKAVVAGVEDSVLGKLKSFLEGRGFAVERALDEKDAGELAKALPADLVLVQFWEDPAVFDAVRLFRDVSGQGGAERFAAFCIPTLRFEALKHLPARSVLSYSSTSELTAKVGRLVEAAV